MTHHEMEKYRNACAALSLIKFNCIQEAFSTDCLQDRPDLQIGQFGIEVTEALLEKQGEKRNVERKMSACENIEKLNEYINNQKYPNKHNFDIVQFPGTKRFSVGTGGGYAKEYLLKIITNCIEKKSAMYYKYPNHERFTKRGLYISAGSILLPSHRVDKDLLQSSINSSAFDVVFIHQTEKMTEIKKSNVQTYEYDFTNKDENIIKCKALRALGYPEYEVYRTRFEEVYGELIL